MELRNPPVNPGTKSLLERKVELVREFVSATRGLYQSLSAGDEAPSARKIQDRQKLILLIDEVDRKLAETSRDPGGFGRTPAGRDHRAYHPLFESLRSLLREAADWDRKCLEQACLLRDQTREELAVLRRGHRAARQYSEPGGREIPSRFMDVRK